MDHRFEKVGEGDNLCFPCELQVPLQPLLFPSLLLQFMDEYDCELIGALDDLELEEEKTELTGNDKRLLDVAIADFEQNYKESHE